MKTIEVKIFACHGFGCCGGSYSSEETIKIEVSDEAGATIKAIINGLKKGEVLGYMTLIEAICKGHDELRPVFDAIAEKHKDMVARYWLFEADNDCIDDSLEPSFWEDVERGLYKPETSIEECVQVHRNDKRYDVWNLDEQEEGRRWLYYCENREAYLNWVNSNEDYDFIAKRTGLDLGAVYEDMPDLVFVIDSVE